ncbi:MAG: DUF5666 domain-containing protein [Chloroflexota bacterium]
MTANVPRPTTSARRLELLRIGIVAVACLALALSAVVVLGASPAPSAGTGAGPNASHDPGKSDHPRLKKIPGGWSGMRAFLKGDRGGDIDGLRGLVGPGLGARSITIVRIAGSTIDLKTDDGWTRTITVTADTKIAKGGAAATLADLKVGDRVVLRQKRNADGTYAIVALTVPIPVVAGTVTAVAAASLTLKTRDGSSRTIELTGKTTYKLGRADGKKSDLKVGSIVVVTGTKGSANAFTATAVRIQVRLDKVGGEVTAKTSDSLTLKQRDGSSVTVKVGSDTKFVVRGAASAGLADIAVGMKVSAAGTRNADGSLNASVVQGRASKRAASPGTGG